MIKWIKQLFCKHDYERITTVMANAFFEETKKLPIQCKKCRKVRLINLN